MISLFVVVLAACQTDPDAPSNMPQAPSVQVEEETLTRVGTALRVTFSGVMADVTVYGVELTDKLFEAGGEIKTLYPETVTEDGFLLSVAGLEPNTNYYLRAFVANGMSKIYSKVITFSTPETSVASVSDVRLEDGMFLTATIEDSGGRSIEDFGFVWGETDDRRSLKRMKRTPGTMGEDGKTFSLPLSALGVGLHYVLAYAEDEKSATGFSRVPHMEDLRPDQAVQFEDSNFERYVVSRFDADGNGKISYAEIGVIESIEVTTDNIRSVREISLMKDLHSLMVTGSGMKDNASSVGKGQLTKLDISANEMLSYVNCSYNAFTSLDFSGNMNLKSINCLGNPMEVLYLSRKQEIETLEVPGGCRIVYVDDEPVTAIELDKTRLELTVGEKETLTATVSPADATDKTVTWISSNEAVATVADGLVTAVAAGEAIITASAGNQTANCFVKVNSTANIEAVDLGLSVMWGNMNIGASAPEDRGGYYAWGETETKENYSWSTYKWCNGTSTSLTKYNTKSDYGMVDNKTVLEVDDDVAHVVLGEKWRMPTDAEWKELQENCTWTPTNTYDYIITSKTNGASIFLPAAGYMRETNLFEGGAEHNYWSSTLSKSYPNEAWHLYLRSESSYDVYRFLGFPVRPVYGDAPVEPTITPSNWLTFTSEGETTVSLANVGSNAPTLYYSTDQKTWTKWDYSELTFTANMPLYMCGDNPEGFSHYNDRYSHFTTNGDNFSVSGSIMSLISLSERKLAFPSNTYYCFGMLFQGCTNLTTPPELPATTLGQACYREMFYGCTSLSSAPELPATTLATSCYKGMFNGCTNLEYAPDLPATTLADGCYWEMFANCTRLVSAPELPATTLAEGCYYYMFDSCTSLVVAPELLAATLASNCYNRMFKDCTSLASAPELPATTLASDCYGGMFLGCTALTSPPELPATTLAESCYYEMFSGCTALTSTPELSATSLAQSCYKGMFEDCESLIYVSELPATELASLCYESMFRGCKSLTSAPSLPASKLEIRSYWGMFWGCSSLNYVKCLATGIYADACLFYWLSGVPSTGTFVRAVGMEGWPTGVSGIPEGWTVEVDGEDPVEPISPTHWLTFTSEGETTLGLTNYIGNAPTLYYSTDKKTWIKWDYSEITFTANMPLYLCGDNPEGFSKSYDIYSTFTASGSPFHSEGSIMSLVNKDDVIDTVPSWCFYYAFSDCSLLKTAPQLPATTLAERCYCRMFEGCTGLTTAPELSATTLAGGCYYYMFSGCTGLTTAPELPATTLAESCYTGMFVNCSSLASAPELPATTLAEGCYNGMFNGCAGLTSAPELPATTLAEHCYSGMFIGCTGLTSAPELPATTLAGHCYRGMFEGCSNLTTAPQLPATTLEIYCYGSMFSGCSSLASAPELPAKTLATYCYERMFSGCSSLTSAPELPATTLAWYCYQGMFSSCSSLTSAPKLPATTLLVNCYAEMFSYCRNLSYIKCLATDISASNCLSLWVENVSQQGTFVKAATMTSWPAGVYGIPEGWTVEDAEEPAGGN